METILRGENINVETYRFMRECGIKAIVLIKFDLAVGPYVAFKSLYEQNIHTLSTLGDPEYLIQFYVGVSGTGMDEITKNGERLIIARHSSTIESTQITDVLLLCITKDVLTSAAIKFADDLLRNSNAEPHILEHTIKNLKKTKPTLKLQLKDTPRKSPIELQKRKDTPKKRKRLQLMRFIKPFYFLEKKEVNGIELSFPLLQKGLYFLRTSLERHDIPRFFDTFLSNMMVEKNTTFSVELCGGNSTANLGLTLLRPTNQRNFVERLAGALTMAEFAITLLRDDEIEKQWRAPLKITRDTTIRISRKNKKFIQVLNSPPRFISLFRSKNVDSLTISKLMHTLESIHATILCKGRGKNKITVEIVLTKMHTDKTEMRQFSLPNSLADHFKKVSGRRNIARAVKSLLLRQCSNGTKLSLQKLMTFFE